MRGDYVVVMAGDGNCLDEYSKLENAKIIAEFTHGYVIDVSTQEIIADYRKGHRALPPDLDQALGLFQQSIGMVLDEISCFDLDPDLLQIKIAARKLDSMISNYCSKE